MSPSAPRVVMNVLGIFSMVCASASYFGWVPMTAGNTSAEMPCCSSLRGAVESEKVKAAAAAGDAHLKSERASRSLREGMFTT